MRICVKLLIVRYHFKRITLLKPHLVCTFFNKLINVINVKENLGLYENFW